MEYDHFAYGEALASALKAISHTSQKKRFFTAFGLEDLISLDDSLSSINGTILIAVDGCESESEDNEADSLNDKQVYSFIVARNTISGNPETINQAAKQCKSNTQINGIGPIGDNFYGTVLTFFVNVPEEFIVDPNYFL